MKTSVHTDFLKICYNYFSKICQKLRVPFIIDMYKWLLYMKTSVHTDFREICYKYFSKICQKIRVPFKTDMYKWYFTWRPVYIRIFVKFVISIFRKSVRNFEFYLKLICISGTLHEDQCTFFVIVSRSVLHRMRNVFRQKL